MQKKTEKKIFDKIVKKNYNNELEEILEKKYFAENVKSTLLSMLYRIDAAYKDYEKVKQDVPPKEEFIQNIIDIIKKDCEDILETIENNNKTEKELIQEQAEDDDTDPFLMDAIDAVVEQGTASTSFIQRRFKVGYARAGRIIDQMEERGIISGYQGSKPREVLITKERLEELKMGTDFQEVEE